MPKLTRVASMMSMLTLPICVAQGMRVRRKTPVLPEATGARSGVVAGTGEPFTLLVFGESSAAGVGVETMEESVGLRTAHRLRQELNRPIHYHIVARSGIRAAEATDELVPLLADIEFDLIVIAIGVNDALQLRRSAQWEHDLTEMIECIWTTANRAPVLLSTIPPFRQFPRLPTPLRQMLALRGRILNAVSVDVARRLGDVTFVPFNDVAGVGFFVSDGFHPGVNGYRRWADLLVESFLASV